jgi:hypothetical protein
MAKQQSKITQYKHMHQNLSTLAFLGMGPGETVI